MVIVSDVSLISTSRGLMILRYSENFELFRDKKIIYVSVGGMLGKVFFYACFHETLYNSASFEYKNKSASYGEQLVPIGMTIICLNIRPPNSTKMLSIRYSSSYRRH